MSANLHAVGLIAMVAVTVFMSRWQWKGKPSSRVVIWSLLAGLGLLFIASTSFTHLCTRGNPSTQPFIGSCCVVALGMCVHNFRTRFLTCLLVLAATLALSWQYSNLVHAKSLTGNPGQAGHLRRQEARLKRIQNAAAKAKAEDPQLFQAGWLHESALAAANPEIKQALADLPEVREIVTPLWHSVFTGLYAVQAQQIHLWYPGASPFDAGKLEWRDYP